MTLRAGIVGCGRVASEFDKEPNSKVVSTHAGAYFAIDGVELVAACDLNREKLELCGKKWGISSLYQDYRQMLAKEALDILSICTWNSTHLEITREAVDGGVKAIFCEKPIADSLRNADEMIELCNNKGVILQINHQRRFDIFHQKTRDYLRNGNLGRIQQVTFYYTAGVANTGSHLFDLLRFYFGDVEWVEGIYSYNSSPNPSDPNVDGWLHFENGLVAVIQACDVSDYTIFEISILGTLGRLRITSGGFEAQFEAVGESTRFAGYKELLPAGPPIDPNRPNDAMLRGVEHLIECLRGSKKSLSSGEDGRQSLEIICALRESADTDGRRIYLPLEDSTITIQSR